MRKQKRGGWRQFPIFHGLFWWVTPLLLGVLSPPGAQAQLTAAWQAGEAETTGSGLTPTSALPGFRKPIVLICSKTLVSFLPPPRTQIPQSDSLPTTGFMRKGKEKRLLTSCSRMQGARTAIGAEQ